MRHTIANLLTNPKMIEKKAEKERKKIEKTIKKRNQKDFFSYKHSSSIRVIKNEYKAAISSNAELNRLNDKYKIKIGSLVFMRPDESDELDDITPAEFRFIDKTQQQIDIEKQEANARIQKAKDYIYMSNDHYKDFQRISQLEMPSLYVIKCIQVILIKIKREIK